MREDLFQSLNRQICPGCHLSFSFLFFLFRFSLPPTPLINHPYQCTASQPPPLPPSPPLSPAWRRAFSISSLPFFFQIFFCDSMKIHNTKLTLCFSISWRGYALLQKTNFKEYFRPSGGEKLRFFEVWPLVVRCSIFFSSYSCTVLLSVHSLVVVRCRQLCYIP